MQRPKLQAIYTLVVRSSATPTPTYLHCSTNLRRSAHCQHCALRAYQQAVLVVLVIEGRKFLRALLVFVIILTKSGRHKGKNNNEKRKIVILF